MTDCVVVLLILDLHQQHLGPEHPTKCFNVTIENNIAHVILNRPDKRNSMNADFWRELTEIIKNIDRGTRARVIVLSSTGPHFSAGPGLISFGGVGQSTEGDEKNENYRPPQRFTSMFYICKVHSTVSKKLVPPSLPASRAVLLVAEWT